VHENGTTENAIKLTAKGRRQVRATNLAPAPALEFLGEAAGPGKLNELFGAVYTVGLEALFVELG
jgi:hypothetical protein